MTLRAWLAALLIVVVTITETGIFAYQLHESRQTAAAMTRNRSVMSLLWAARAIENGPADIQDEITAAFAQTDRVLFLEGQSAIRPGDETLDDWAVTVSDWLRGLHNLDFRSLTVARRIVYLRPAPPEDTVQTASRGPMGVERLRVPLPGFRDGRTPGWVRSEPSAERVRAEGLRPVPAFIYSLELPDGRWLNMYALPNQQPRGGLALRIAVVFGAWAVAIAIAIWLGNRLMRPFAELGAAAAAIGRGEATGPMRVRGPSDVRRTTEDFNRMGDRIAQANAYRAALLQSLGHDLRGPLAGARSALDRVDMKEDERAAVAERLAAADAILDPIVKFTQSTLTDGPVEVTDLAALTEAVAETSGGDSSAVTIAAPASLYVRSRFNALERVIANLIDNALKYAGAVHIELIAQPGAAVMRFLDRGAGIPPEELENVFRPFYRSRNGRSEAEGFGLGLAIAKAIVLDHGGTISLANRDGGGLAVEVTLPRDDR